MVRVPRYPTWRAADERPHRWEVVSQGDQGENATTCARRLAVSLSAERDTPKQGETSMAIIYETRSDGTIHVPNRGSMRFDVQLTPAELAEAVRVVFATLAE
jgi:hypothetical protein